MTYFRIASRRNQVLPRAGALKRLTAIALVSALMLACPSNARLNLPHYDPEASIPRIYEEKKLFIYPPRSARAQLVEFDSAAQSLIAAPDTAVRRFFRDHRDDFSTSTVDGAEAYEKALRTILPAVVHRISNREYVKGWLRTLVEGVSEIGHAECEDTVCHFETAKDREAFVDALSQYLEYKSYTRGRLTSPESLVDSFQDAIYVGTVEKDGKCPEKPADASASKDGKDKKAKAVTTPPPNDTLKIVDDARLLPFLQRRGGLKPVARGRLWEVLRVGIRNRGYLLSAIKESVGQRQELFASGRSEPFINEFYQAFQGQADDLAAEETSSVADYDYWWLTLYPKVIPAHQRVKATTTVTLDFGRRLVPEDQYRRWLIDHRLPVRDRMLRAIDEMILIESLLPSDPELQEPPITQWLDELKKSLRLEKSAKSEESAAPKGPMRSRGAVREKKKEAKQGDSIEAPPLCEKEPKHDQAPKGVAEKHPKRIQAPEEVVEEEPKLDEAHPAEKSWMAKSRRDLKEEIETYKSPDKDSKSTVDFALVILNATTPLREQQPPPERDDIWRWPLVRKAATLALLDDILEERAVTVDRVNHLIRCYVSAVRSDLVRGALKEKNAVENTHQGRVQGLRADATSPIAGLSADADQFLKGVGDLIDDRFIALYPEVPSPQALQDGIMALPGATQALVTLFFHDELVRLDERLSRLKPGPSTADTMSKCQDLECVARARTGTDNESMEDYATILRQSLLDIFARFPVLEEEVREEIERGLIQAVAARLSQLRSNATKVPATKLQEKTLLAFTKFLSIPSVHESLRSYMVRIYFKDLWNALFRYCDIDRALDYRDIASEAAVYDSFLTDARVHVQEGLQIQEMLPLSKDELVAKSVNSGGLAAKVTAKGAFAASAAAEYSGGSTSTRTRSSASPAVLEGAQEAPFDLPASTETITLSTSAGDADPLTISFVAGKPARVRLPAGPYDLTGKAGFQCAVGAKPSTPIDLATQEAQLRLDVKPMVVDDTIRKVSLQLRICNMDDDCKDSNAPDAGQLIKVPMKTLGAKADIGTLQNILEGGTKSCNACYGVTREGNETLVVTSKARGSGARIAMVEDPNVEKVLTPKEGKRSGSGSGPLFDASQAQASEIKDVLTKRLGAGVKVEADAGGGLILETVATGAGATLTLRPPAEGDSALASIGLNTGTYKGSGGFRDPHAASAQETATYLDRLTSSRGVHVSAKGRGLVFQTDARGSAAYLKISGDPAVRIGYTPDQEAKGQATRREGNTVTSFQSGVTQAASFSAAASGNVTGGLLARMQHAYVYSQQKEYLNAIVTAAGRGSTTARWIIWPGPSSLAGSSKGRYQGYPNGDQPFYVLLRVPRKAVHRAWDGSQYIYFNSGFGMEKKRGQSAVVRFPFMYEVTNADDRASTQARLANVLGGRIRLDTTDKIPYSTILKMVNDEETFIETARTTQSAALETASTTIQGEIPSQVEKPTAPPSQPQ